MAQETPDNSPANVNPAALEKTMVEQAPSRFECLGCGYVYEPEKGDSTHEIAPHTEFADLPTSWRCPVCGARKSQFQNIGAANVPSGFQENLGYGFGVNNLTPGQKNILIFGGLLLAFLFFLSLYGLH